MAAVTKGRRPRMFATADPIGLRFRDVHLRRRKTGTLVTAVAPRLVGAVAAGTPPIGAGL